MTPLSRRPRTICPHVAPQLDVDAGGRLVEEQDLRLVRERLGDHHAALHAARQRHDLAVLLVPQRQVAQHLLEVGRVRRLAEQAAAEAAPWPTRSRTRRWTAPAAPGRSWRAPRGSRGTMSWPSAVHRAGASALTMPQTMLISVVLPAPFGPEQREDLAAADLEVDVLQRLEARGVGLGRPWTEMIGGMASLPRPACPMAGAVRCLRACLGSRGGARSSGEAASPITMPVWRCFRQRELPAAASRG